MRTLFFLLVITNLTSCAQHKVTGTDLYQITGNVKTVKTKSYKAIWNENAWNPDPKDTIPVLDLIIFDKNKNILKEQRYSNFHNRFEDKIIYEYKKGTIDRILTVDGGKLIRTEYILKAEPNCKVLILYSTDSFSQNNDTTRMEWSKNRLVKILRDNNHISLEYDKNGNCIKQIQIENDQTSETTLYEYISFDGHGNWTKRVMYNKDNLNDNPFIDERELTYF